MTGVFRTAAGGRIDRARPLAFRFDGRPYAGCAGDTLASALLANGVHLVGRSFKYHRPRGILAAGSEEPNALVGVDRGAGRYAPNLRATQVELHEGLSAESQNRFPSLRFDLAAALQPLLSSGPLDALDSDGDGLITEADTAADNSLRFGLLSPLSWSVTVDPS